MGLLKALFACAYIIAGIEGLPQRNRTHYSKYRIPATTSDGRPECPLVKSLKELVPNCSGVLPIDNSYFDSREVLLCFGVYDTHYELCKYNASQTDIDVPDYEIKGFCTKAKMALEKYETERTNALIKDWAPRLKTALSDSENCTSLCNFENTELNPLCSRIVRALEKYPEKESSSKPAEPEPAAQNPMKTDGSYVNAKSKLATPEVAVIGAPNPAVVNQVAASPAGEASPGSMVVDSQGRDGSVVNSPVGVSQAATRPQSPVPKLNGPTVADVFPAGQPLSSSFVAPKAPEAADSKPEKMAEEPAEESPIGLNEDIEQQSQDPDPEEPKEDIPEESAKVSNADKDIEDQSKMEEFQRPMMMGRLDDDEESNLVTYFILMTGGALLFYVAFHNKNKLLALALEGRRANRRGGGRHSSAAYSKLHSNLEEAIAAGPNSPSTTHVLY